jgi:hypothetical protein
VDSRSLSNVLAVLRFVKSKNPNTSGVDLLSALAVETTRMQPSQAAVMKMAAQIIDQAEDARVVITNSSLDEEAKHGVQVALDRVANAFSLQKITGAPYQTIGDVAGAISNLVILLSASGFQTATVTPPEASDLAKEVEELMNSFGDAALDPLVRATAQQHLQILATMLRHLPIFGMEAAMATYFELMLKVKRADANTSDEQKEAAKPFMEKIGALGDGISKTEKAWTAGARLIGHAKSAAVLFGLLPPS